ncbi:MAG: SDR family oxidoreductase [Methylobacteriaceae bacterium]|nr:SDR family oxidoreductase [Methylobacteriaceae bacterium]
MSLFILGLGYSAMHYLTTRTASERIVGTVRSLNKAQRIQASHANIEALVFDAAAMDVAIESRVASATRLLISIPPSESGDPVHVHFAETIARAPGLEQIVYLSTIGVYGDANGAWIDEAAPLEPNSVRNRARVTAEQQWIALAQRAGKRLTILRLAGIYGPGQNALVNLREGKARRIVKPQQVFNRIHVEDIARAIEAAFATDAPGGIFNVTDDEPAPPQDVIAYGAELLGMTPPPETPFDGADLTPMARSFYSSNKRVSNRRMKEELGVRLTYPTYREGLRALAAQLSRDEIVGAGPRIS